MEGEQGGFETVHCKTFVPTPSKLTLLIGELGVAKVALPEITLHIPVPFVMGFAPIVELVVHKDWSGPATAKSGAGTTTM